MNTPELDGVVRSVCMLCLKGCGILAHLENGKVVKAEGDREHPVKGREER